MSGIPVYIQSPINATKADGITPQTATSPTSTTTAPPISNAATTTAAPSTSNTYPAAQPGVVVGPAPTGSAARRYAPVSPTPTTASNDGPPPPQPGAFPTPPTSVSSNLPPPPKVGEKYQPPPLTTTSLPQPYPPQMSVPPPTNIFGAQPPSSSTSTANAPYTPSSSYPVPLPSAQPGGPVNLAHPPGYVQNPNASDLTSEQRRASDAQAASSGGYSVASLSGNSGGVTGALGIDAEGVWNTAKKWAQTAGEKLQEGEAEVWKRINGGK